MQASKCTCGKIVVLNRKICPNCGKQMTSTEVGNDAEILTHTKLFTVPEGFNSPIFLVLVEFEQEINLLCECKSENDLKIGKKGKIVKEKNKYYFVSNSK
jgi:uncharacterized OB-fold protein